MGRANDQPNPLRTCPQCARVLETITTRPQPDGSVKRLKRCCEGHEIVTFERLGIEEPERPKSFTTSKRKGIRS
jgi:hypothetical protein